MRVVFKILNFVIIFLVASFIAKGQTLQIFNLQSSEPVSYATLTDEVNGIIISSDESGRANLKEFETSIEILITAIGYQPLKISLSQIKRFDYKVYLIEDDIIMDQIVVSTTKFNRNSVDLASRVQVVDNNRIVLLNPQTSADLLGSMGEVFIQKSQAGGGSPMIRGFAANRLLYAVDGVRMNTAIFRSGNLQNVISLDPFTLERTEVLFGPGSVIYGSDAIGGVMSFSTKIPRLASDEKYKIGGNITARYSSANGEKTFHADINIAKNRLSSVTSFTRSSFDDLKMGKVGNYNYQKKFLVVKESNIDKVVSNPSPFVQAPSGYEQINFMQKLRYKISQNWDIQYALHLSNVASFARYDRLLETDQNEKPIYAIWNYGPQIWHMQQLSLSNDKKTKVCDRLALRIAYQFFEESRIDRRFENIRLRTQKEQVNAFTSNLDFEKKVRKTTLNYGAEYVLNIVDSEGSAIDYISKANISVADRYPHSEWYSTAAYISFHRHLGKKSIFEAGTRFSYFGLNANFTRLLQFYDFEFEKTELKSGNVSGNIGFVHKYSDKLKFSIQLGTGFRAPNVDDIGKLFDFTAGNINVPNPDLKNEHVYNAEINLNGVFSERIQWDFSVYYTYLDDAMVRRPYTINGQDSIFYNGILSKSFAMQNAAFARNFGSHFGLKFNIGNGFYSGVKINLQNGIEEMDNGTKARSRHTAPPFGEFEFGFKSKKFNVELYSQFSAKVSFENLNPEEQSKPFIYAKDENGNPFSPAWYIINIKTKYQLATYLSINAGVENIADLMYRPYSSGIAAPGRNFVFSISASF